MLNDNRLQAADLIEQLGIEKFMDRNADAAADSVDGTQTDVVIIAAHKLPQGRFRNIADLAKRKQRKIILRTYFSDPSFSCLFLLCIIVTGEKLNRLVMAENKTVLNHGFVLYLKRKEEPDGMRGMAESGSLSALKTGRPGCRSGGGFCFATGRIDY